jgi:hypothetical protein
MHEGFWALYAYCINDAAVFGIKAETKPEIVCEKLMSQSGNAYLSMKQERYGWSFLRLGTIIASTSWLAME